MGRDGSVLLSRRQGAPPPYFFILAHVIEIFRVTYVTTFGGVCHGLARKGGKEKPEGKLNPFGRDDEMDVLLSPAGA
jgi:hypothetical protein